MKILLVDNLVLPEEGSLALLDLHPHLGLLALASVAERQGHTVRIYDPKRLLRWGHLPYDSSLYERAAIELLSWAPDAVGFTALGCSFLFALGVARILKRCRPDLPILLGGPHATMLHEKILERFPQFDVIVRHEADETFAPVLSELGHRSFERIPGISWRTSPGSSDLRFTEGKPKVDDLDSLPFLSYDYYPVPQLDLELLRIEAGRGCPFLCTFCSTAGFFQRSFRLKSAERLVQELDILHYRYGYADFKLDHDMFTVSRRKVAEFCDAVKQRGYRWRASARVDCVDEELLVKMAEAGCVGLYFGIETGSARMQRICQKRLDLSLVHPILNVAEGLGIQTTASFITGYPEEVEQDQNDTLDMLGQCFRRACLPQLHILAPEPGTPMFGQFGDQMEYDGYGGPYNTRLVGTDDEQLVRAHPDIFPTYYYYPAAMPRSRYIFAVEAVDVLRRTGPIVWNYLLRAYDRQLSKLVGDLRGFAELREPGARPDQAMIEDFLRFRFGARHHVTSLFRYSSLAGVPRDEPRLTKPVAPVLQQGQAYRLNPDVRVLGDLHDCGSLLQRIESEPLHSPLLNDADAGDRGVYLIKTTGHSSITYQIHPGVEAILSLFEEPRTCGEVATLVCQATGLPKLELAFFEELVQKEILVAPTSRAAG